MKLGVPITTEQAVWAILVEINSPVVGDLRAYSHTFQALDYCMKPEVFGCLSSGEKRLVNIALSVHTANENGTGVAVLGALDPTLRRKVWLILGYLYLGRDVAHGLNDVEMEFS